MIKQLQTFFSDLMPTADQTKTVDEHTLQVLSAALMVEVAKADHHLAAEELKTIVGILKQEYTLSDEEAQSLLILAQDQSEESSSLYALSSQVDKQLNYEDKKQLVCHLWKVAFADKDKDKYEEYTIRKVADLLHLSHKDFIQARMISEENS